MRIKHLFSAKEKCHDLFYFSGGEGENLLDDILDDYHKGDDFTVEMSEESGNWIKPGVCDFVINAF